MDGPLPEKYLPFSFQHYISPPYKYEVKEDGEKFTVFITFKESKGKAYIYGGWTSMKQLNGDYQIFVDDKCFNFNFDEGVLNREPGVVALNSDNGSGCYYSYNLHHKVFSRVEKHYKNTLLNEIKYIFYNFPTIVDTYHLNEPISEEELVNGFIPQKRLDKVTGTRTVGERLVAKFYFYSSLSEETYICNNKTKEKFLDIFSLHPIVKGVRLVEFNSHPLLDFFLPIPIERRKREEFLRAIYSDSGALTSLKILNKEKRVIRTIIENEEIIETIFNNWCDLASIDINQEFKFGSFNY